MSSYSSKYIECGTNRQSINISRLYDNNNNDDVNNNNIIIIIIVVAIAILDHIHFIIVIVATRDSDQILFPRRRGADTHGGTVRRCQNPTNINDSNMSSFCRQ
jgi:hypothetical protein